MGLTTWLGLKRRKLATQIYFGPYAQGPWGEIQRAYSYSDHFWAPDLAFNYHAQANARRMNKAPLPWLDESNCLVSLEMLAWQEIDYINRWHGKAQPRVLGPPIIAIEIDGKRGVLDGNNRANRIVEIRRREPYPVLLVTFLPAKNGWPQRESWLSNVT